MCQSLKRALKDVSNAAVKYDEAFDAEAEVVCACDQGFRGPDCSLIECPSKADPMGGYGFNGKNRDSVTADGPHMDCSGRGTCDYTSGACGCFKGVSLIKVALPSSPVHPLTPLFHRLRWPCL